MQNRVIFSNNGSLEDFSRNLLSYRANSSVMPFVAAEDALYIGAKLPFNHFYVKMDVANTNPSAMSIQYWDGTIWQDVVDQSDETTGFTSSGYVSFLPNRDEIWYKQDTNYNQDLITGLEDIVIYDMYWIKITFSANLSSTTSIAWLGNKFSDDDDLNSEFPDLLRSSSMDSFEIGKTDWEEQHVKAAGILIQDLINKGVIHGNGQILNRHDYLDAAVMKTAEIIYRSFGDDYKDDAIIARQEYDSRLSKRIHRVDLNNNAIEDPRDTENTVGWLSR